MAPVPAPPEPPIENLIRCQVVFTDHTGLPENQYVNTLYFRKPTSASFIDACDALHPHVGELYTLALTTPFAAPAIGTNLASYIARAFTLKFYDMSLPAGSRVPRTYVKTLPAAGAATNLASELAICISFAGINPLGLPPRGRIYVGPLNTVAANQGSATAYARPSTTVTDGWRYMVDRFGEAVNALTLGDLTFDWVIYSPKHDDAFQVRSGYVDDEWDVQRRRGHDPTNRAAFTLPA